jgi:two-component system KDP operon response regulator KdpE
MKNLREKLEPEPGRPRYLVTEIGLGYRLKIGEGRAPQRGLRSSS